MATYFGFKAYDADNGKDPFVFVSYKSEDSETVAVYAKHLHDSGINVWYDDGIHEGDDWESYIMSVIEKENCRAVLLFVSANIEKSSVIPLETTCARQCKKPTVAVFLEGGLDLAVLLSKAMKIYIEQRQSVNAYGDTIEKACERVLAAAKNAMSGEQKVSAASANDELWNTAQFFIINAGRSGSDGDIGKAKGMFREMTEKVPTDYRGWLGLAVCELILPIKDIDSALRRLYNASGYYSYVVSAGADNMATDEYTDRKSRMWRNVLDALEKEADSCTSYEQAQKFRAKLTSFGKCMGHTASDVAVGYGKLLEKLDGAMEDLKKKDFYEGFEWRVLSKKKAELVKSKGRPEGDLVIPDTFEGRAVVRIASGAFDCCDRLVSVKIPHSVKKIGKNAFNGCGAITVYGKGGMSSCARKYAKKNGFKFEKTK